MKALFVHDHVFYKSKENTIYSAGGFPKHLWGKYTDVFGSLTVLARGQDIGVNVERNHVLSAMPEDSINFIFVKSIASPVKLVKNYLETTKFISNAVKNSDIVIARLPSENGLQAIKYAKKYNKKYIVEVVGCVWDGLWNYGNLSAKMYAPIAYIRMRKAINTSINILYVTNEFLQNRYPYNDDAMIVSASNVNINSKGNAITISLNKVLTIGLIGNFKTNYKGIDIALEALGALKKDKVNFVFKVLGNGNEQAYYSLIKKNNLEGDVVFCSSLPSGQPVLDWLDNIDIYIQPSRQEGLPRALIEAMSRGCICIGSTAGGIPELLESEFVHKKGSSKELYVRIRQSLTMRNLDSHRERNISESQKYKYTYINKIRQDFFEKVKGQNESS